MSATGIGTSSEHLLTRNKKKLLATRHEAQFEALKDGLRKSGGNWRAWAPVMA